MDREKLNKASHDMNFVKDCRQKLNFLEDNKKSGEIYYEAHK